MLHISPRPPILPMSGSFVTFEAVLDCEAQRGGWFVVLFQIVCLNACQNVAQVLSGAIRTNGLK